MFRKISETFLAAPQISVSDIAAAKEQGVTMIINNRPDGEEPDAPQSDEIEIAAKAAGMDYAAIAVTHAGFSHPQIDAMIAAMSDAGDGKVLAYCRSGTRSTLLWALAQAKSGMHPAEISARAESAGYDVSPIAAMLDMLWGQKDQ
jgi:uncharacterized protein (TIGR01244 family)